MEGVRLPGLSERKMMKGSGKGASLIQFNWAPFLDIDCVRSLSLGAIWNCYEGSGPGLPWLGIRVWGTQGVFEGLGASRPKGLEPTHYSVPFWDVNTVESYPPTFRKHHFPSQRTPDSPEDWNLKPALFIQFSAASCWTV